jgi:dolichyl-phosphate-mannose-protein mannosyltransferase
VAKAPRIAALALLGSLLCVNMYRASTQALTHDEALTYLFYLTGPVLRIFAIGDPNNHLLATLLMKLSTTVFGLSELAIRLPSVAAGVLYFFAVYRICLLVFGEGLLCLLSVALLSLNPLVLDFLVAARGYGPAAAFLFFGLYCLLLYRTRRRYHFRLLNLAGVAVSCAVMSNASLVFPAFVTVALFLSTLPAPEPPRKPDKRHKRAPVAPRPDRKKEALHLLLPICCLAILFWALNPVSVHPAGGLYRIAGGFRGSIESLTASVFAHNQGLGRLNQDSSALQTWRSALALGVLPGIVLASLALSLGTKRRDEAGLLLLWTSGIVAGSLLIHVVANRLWRIPYPANRSGLEYLPLIGLALVSLVKVLQGRADLWRFARWPALGLALLFTLQYTIQFHWDYFYMWEFDADNKRILDRIQAVSPSPKSPVRLGTSWQLAPSLEYYRDTKSLRWLAPTTRNGPYGDFDYYVLLEQDRGVVEDKKLKILYQGEISRTILARPLESPPSGVQGMVPKGSP